FEEKSGQFRVTSRDLPLALVFPQHKGMVHWQAQLMLTEHFGLDYEIYGKVQKHVSDTLELGDADFHITGQMDRDHFEFSKFSIDVNQNGSIQGSGLFRFADPLGSFRSVLYMDSIHINSLIKSPLITPKTKISSAKVELRNRILNFKSSEVSVAGGKLNVDLSSEIDKDFRKVLSSAKGKLKFEKLLMSELVPSLPYNIPKVPLQLSGYIVPQAEFAINLRALKPGSTNLELLGTNKFGQSVQVPKLQLNGIVDIEDLITDTSFHKFNAKSKFKVIGELKPNKLEFEVNSESLQFQLAETSSPILVKNLESSSVVDFEGNFEFKDIRFDIFSGRVNTVLSGNIYSLESVIANANIKGVSINQLITSINPVMEGHFDGKLNSKLDVIEHTGNSSHTYPVRVIGSFNVSKPSYTYHKSVVGAISSLNKSLNQSFLKKIVKREQRNWQEAIEKKSEFLDTTPQPLYFEDKRIQVQSLQLIEGQRRFSLKTSKPILLDLPDEFRASGYCSTEIQLLATSQFIKEKFKFLKDSYDQDLELVLALEGPINNPISQSQLDVLKQKVIQRIGKNIDPKKVEQAAKEAAKQAAKKLKKNLKKKGQELLNKVLNLSTSDEEKRVSVKQQASVTSAVVDVEKKKSDEVKQQVKKKLRSFLQDLF
ncbi:MAG: hypothetical protein VX619_01895, partial [bacterium]|nr:hypothetical protein [bacterium]